MLGGSQMDSSQSRLILRLAEQFMSKGVLGMSPSVPRNNSCCRHVAVDSQVSMISSLAKYTDLSRTEKVVAARGLEEVRCCNVIREDCDSAGKQM